MPSHPSAPRVLVVANQKGGVGKTTTAINLGTALAAIGEHVLLIDLDPQGNASTGLGVDRKERTISTYDVMLGEATLQQAAQTTNVPRLDIAPSTLDLLGAETELSAEKNRIGRLKAAISQLHQNADDIGYSYILIDCPPSSIS